MVGSYFPPKGGGLFATLTHYPVKNTDGVRLLSSSKASHDSNPSGFFLPLFAGFIRHFLALDRSDMHFRCCTFPEGKSPNRCPRQHDEGHA